MITNTNTLYRAKLINKFGMFYQEICLNNKLSHLVKSKTYLYMIVYILYVFIF